MMSVESIQGPIFALKPAIASSPPSAAAIASAHAFGLLFGFAASDAAL
jgi:hypothetical protein